MWPFTARTNHKAGGLRASDPKLAKHLFSAPRGLKSLREWEYPPYLDGRPYLLPSDDQGQTSSCTGFACAGIEEALEWAKTGKKKTVDAFVLYAKAKQNDGNNNDGTTLESIIKAAQQLGYLEQVEVFDIENSLDFRYAMHKFPLVLLGLNITDNWNKVGSNGKIPEGGKSIGGHAIIGCYYDEYGPGIVNSWGRHFGDHGRAYLSWKQFAEQFMSAKGFVIK